MNAGRFDPDAPCLVLASHLDYPTRSGADISLDRLARFLSDDVPHVDLVAQQQVIRYRDQSVVQVESFDNALRPRWQSGVRALLLRSHYLLEKFLTPQYAKVARRHLNRPAYGTVLFSYALTTHLLDDAASPDDRLHLVWTHNDQFKWFQDRASQASNPLARWVAQSSERWLHDFFRRHERDFLFLHVTEADRQGFARYYPDHDSLVVPIGVDVDAEPAPPRSPEQAPVRLLFVGALGVQMNRDALAHFATRFEPALRERLADQLEVMVVGSNPSSAVQQLCRQHGWTLHPNVSDEELHRLYRTATFSMLPFAYATGAKLKLLEALAHGVPFLATGKVEAQLDDVPPACLLADDPADWRTHVEQVQQRGISAEQRKALVEIAQQHSWAAQARHLYEALQERATAA